MFRRVLILVSFVAALLAACSPVDVPVVDEPTQEDPQTPEPEPYYVPKLKIYVEDEGVIDSKDEYKNVTVDLVEGYEIVLSANGRAKGRGNATWGYDKKPYKIKFDQKQSFFGLTANKDWVLLAEYCDKSLMRTAYMCELAQTVGLPYPIHYHHVQLYLNGKYSGMYVLTDQVEKKGGRVDIEDDGFLFENDNYFWEEPVNFMTDRRQYWYTFKYPDPEDGEIAAGDENYNFIKGFMNDFEAALYGDAFKDPANGYRKYIDVQSFAKWFLVQELIANLEPNMYYVLPSRNSKLQIGPVWDAEWSLGLAYREDEYASWAALPTEPDPDQAIWSKWKYFGRLFEDPYFVNAVRTEWNKLKPHIPAFKEKMTALAEGISEGQVMNFQKWNIFGWHVSVGLVRFDTWEEEVKYVSDFFDHRVQWLDAYLATL